MPIISDTGQTNIGHQELGMSFLARGGRANGMSGSEAGEVIRKVVINQKFLTKK